MPSRKIAAAKIETLPVDEVIQSEILVVRGLRVMLSHDLAALYGVETKVLIQAVKRNAERFPTDFMFQLTNQEAGL
jgi:ORF6N domain